MDLVGPQPREKATVPPDGTPSPNGVNQVGHGGPVNSDFSQLVPLARLPESQDPVGSPRYGTELFLVHY